MLKIENNLEGDLENLGRELKDNSFDNLENKNGLIKTYILSLSSIVLLVILDQVTKYSACLNLKPVGNIPVIQNVLHMAYVENSGAAFGMFVGARWIFIVLTVIILIVIACYFIKLPNDKANNLLRISLVMISSGAIGNFIDRFLNGYVVDFIYFAIIDFPVFNVADILVVCGVLLLAVFQLFGGKIYRKVL